MVIIIDGSFRGNKTIDLKGIVDEALLECPCVDSVLVVERTMTEVRMKTIEISFWPLIGKSFN